MGCMRIQNFCIILKSSSFEMQDLSGILVKLSQRILNVNESRKLKLSKLLLNSLDSQFFSQGSLLQISTFSELNTDISAYYRQKFNQRIKDSFFYQIQLQDKFVAFYKLMMDMALSGQRKDEFLNAILDMTENEKNLLMEFVAEVVKRDEYIDLNKQENNSITAADSILLEEKFVELKEQYKEFQKIYLQLLDSHQSLKKNHQKVLMELQNIQGEKCELLDDLGLHQNAGYTDIIDKYRKDVEDFSEDIAKLNRDLEEKSSQLKRKEKQNQQLILSFSTKQQHLSQTYEEKMTNLIKKQALIEKKLQESTQKQEQYRFQIGRLKQVIVDLRKELQQKNSKLLEQETVIDKFNKMKKLHLEFRKLMVDNYRNGNNLLANNSGGISL